MGKFKIEARAEKCTGCLRCQLACSYLYTRTFNPNEARICLDVSGADFSIYFNEDCSECGVCADDCFFDALEKFVEEAVS